MRVLLCFVAAAATGEFTTYNEVSRLGDLYKKGFISEEQFSEMKSNALKNHYQAKSQRRATLEARIAATERRKLGAGDTAPQSKCLASMVTDTKRKIDAIADDIKKGANPTLAALWKFVVMEGGGSAQLSPVVSQNKKQNALHAEQVIEAADTITNMNKQILTRLTQAATGDLGDCQPIEARNKDVGTYGQINSSGSKYYFTAWSVTAALIDGDTKTNVDATTEACAIKTRGPCNKCVKVYGSPENYHQMAWSKDGKAWAGFAVNAWTKCFGTSCPSAYGGSKSQGSMPLPITFKPWQGMTWQYAVYSQASGSRRIYEMEVVNCPNEGGI